MVNRYSFYTIFLVNPVTGDISTLYNIIINGVPFQQGTIIPRGNAFGGLDLYNVKRTDVAGIWNSDNHTLTIVGFF
jgi:hypothetical protein